ncbi:MAG: hypothetical protein AB7I79_00060 [Rhizobiaceae bacterium]
MRRTLSARIANHVSANHPTLWALRLDVVLAASAVYLTLGMVIVWLGASTRRSFAGPELETPIINTVIMFLVLFALLTFFVWILAAKRAAYRDVSPRMRGHPRILDLTLAGTALCLLVFALATYAGRTIRGELVVASGAEWIGLLFMAFETSLFVSSFAYVAIRLSLKAALIIVIVFISLLAGAAWVYSFLPGSTVFMVISAVYLALLLWLYAGPTRVSVGIAVAASLLPTTQIALLSVGTELLKAVGVTPGEAYMGAEAFFGGHAILSVVVMEAISRKMVRLRLLPA